VDNLVDLIVGEIWMFAIKASDVVEFLDLRMEGNNAMFLMEKHTSISLERKVEECRRSLVVIWHG